MKTGIGFSVEWDNEKRVSTEVNFWQLPGLLKLIFIENILAQQ